MSIYDEMQGVAQSLFAEFDQGGIVYQRLVPGNGPPDDPGPPMPVLTPIPGVAKGVSFKYIGTTAANGTLIVGTDLQVTLPVQSSVVPDMADMVNISAVQHKIVQIIKLPAAGTVVAYRLIVRR